MLIKNVFITGGLGFIGSNLVKALIRVGYRVKIYDNCSSGNINKLRKLGVNTHSGNISIINADILDTKKVVRQMRGADCVIHHAAQLEITKSVSDPLFDLKSNTIGTLNVLNAMLTNNVKYLLNASSACVYGQKSVEEIPTKEEDQTNPNWSYGISKLTAEKYCSVYADIYGLRIISTRYAIIYGQNEWYGRVMTLFIKNSFQNKPLIIFGNGIQKRDFTNVSDVVDFDLRAIRYFTKGIKPANFHEVFNVSTGVGTTIKKLADFIKQYAMQILDKKIDLIFDKEVKEGEKSQLIDRLRLPNELQNMVLDNSKAKKILYWEPKIGLEKGLKKQILWARKNLDLWKTMSY